MRNEKNLFIESSIINKYNELMELDFIAYDEHDIPRYSTIESWTTDFGNGFEVDLKVCSSNYDEPIWCEAVLFLNGNEISCSDVEDKLNGEWIFNYNDIEFILHVIKK